MVLAVAPCLRMNVEDLLRCIPEVRHGLDLAPLELRIVALFDLTAHHQRPLASLLQAHCLAAA